MLLKFKQGNSAKAIAEEICSVKGVSLIQDRAVINRLHDYFLEIRL